jgi:hypothetical protein
MAYVCWVYVVYVHMISLNSVLRMSVCGVMISLYDVRMMRIYAVELISLYDVLVMSMYAVKRISSYSIVLDKCTGPYSTVYGVPSVSTVFIWSMMSGYRTWSVYKYVV